MKKYTFKIHLFDLIAAMVFIGKKVTPEDLTNHFYQENWADADKYAILGAVKDSLKREMEKQEGPRPEDHYGIRKAKGGDLYWLSYNVEGGL